MSIANRTADEVYVLSGVLENALKALLVYRSESLNPVRTAALNAQLTDAMNLMYNTVTDATPPAG